MASPTSPADRLRAKPRPPRLAKCLTSFAAARRRLLADERRGFRPGLDVQPGVVELESDVEEAGAGDQVGRSTLIALTAQQARPHEGGNEPRRPISQTLAELRLAEHQWRFLGPRLTQLFPDAQPLLERQAATRRLSQGVADGAQVQAAVLELGNEPQSLEVLLPVQRDAPPARGWWKGAHPLVVPHGPARHARRRGQLVDRIGGASAAPFSPPAPR